METLTAVLRQIARLFTWWAMVAPWEQAIRVRGGKRVRRLAPGVHLRVPFLDTVHVQTVRMRVTTLPMQTVMTLDRRTLTVGATVAYAIADIEQLYRTLHHAEDTIMNLAAVALADYAASQTGDALTPATLAGGASAKLELSQYGLADVTIRVTDFAFIKAYRFLNDRRWGGHGEALRLSVPAGE